MTTHADNDSRSVVVNIKKNLSLRENADSTRQPSAPAPSKTLWTEGDARIDVENPAPGRRPGMIHYQNGSRGSTQYIFDIKLGSFRGLTQAENEKLLSNPMVQPAIQKGLRYLGVR